MTVSTEYGSHVRTLSACVWPEGSRKSSLAKRRIHRNGSKRSENSNKTSKALCEAAECRFFIVEKSLVMVYNKQINF